MEFYAQQTLEGFEIPSIFDDQDLLKKARYHFDAVCYALRNKKYRKTLDTTLLLFYAVIIICLDLNTCECNGTTLENNRRSGGFQKDAAAIFMKNHERMNS